MSWTWNCRLDPPVMTHKICFRGRNGWILKVALARAQDCRSRNLSSPLRGPRVQVGRKNMKSAAFSLCKGLSLNLFRRPKSSQDDEEKRQRYPQKPGRQIGSNSLHRCPFWSIWSKIEGSGLPGDSINYQGHLLSQKRTPMIVLVLLSRTPCC